ncbi:single-stranded DNA-binding protein [Reichenbachiella agarivorans]|uniref:Single-stranded DNA-binding protein n=1 Tax=Reichenbachiella agarivorans TaxID=2979464 RepID=A0ABY6CSU3_9BACT|nr:single-stranded DNA-binding protein [Reichenbachiella agarivorans]UXP33587.1 single-stranded DNA-binding protein [Reichenbachiella agarivorans]
MAGVNKVILVGNLGKDPEVRHLENGRAVANFSMATSETYKNKQGERVTTTEWHNLVLWSPLAEIAEKYLKKGNQVYIEGKLTSRSYEDKDGVTKYITEVVGREMTLLGGRPDGAASGDYSSNSQPTKTEIVDSTVEDSNEIDDLPF